MNWKKIIFFCLGGYFLAMLLSRYIKDKKDKKKMTIAGIVGSVATAQNSPALSAFFGGLALYETGEDAGLTFNQTPKTENKELGKIKKGKVSATEKMEWEDREFYLTFSKWFFPYEILENVTRSRFVSKHVPKVERTDFTKKTSVEDLRKTKMHEYTQEPPLQAVGCYMIRDTRTGKIVYIGASSKATQDKSKRQRGLYERIYRHFQAPEPTGYYYKIGADGKNYDVCIVQINNPNTYRIESLERYLHFVFQPTDSQPENKRMLFDRYGEQDEDYEFIIPDMELPADFFVYEDDRPEYQQAQVLDDEPPF